MKKVIAILLVVFFVAFSGNCVATTVKVQKGDILIFIHEAGSPDEYGYLAQAYLSFFEAAGKEAGVYDSYGNLKTWDDTKYPTGKRNFCGHAEMVLKNKDYEVPGDWDVAVLRPTALMKSLVNFNEAIKKAREVLNTKISYSQPFIYVLIKWIKSGIEWQNETLFARWKEAYGIDFDNIEPKAAQYSPYLGLWAGVHNDIGDLDFFKRDMDCSSLTMWFLWYGYYEGAGGEKFREWLRDTPEGEALANATDCLAPGQLAWWLEKTGLAYIVAIASPD